MSKHYVKPCCPPCDIRPPHDDCFEPCPPCPPLDDCFPHHHHHHFDSSCGETKYYKLPLWKANTVTSWLYGINKAMMQIDFLFHQFALRTAINGSTDELQNLVEKLELDVDCLNSQVSKSIQEIAELSKVLADSLATDEVRDEKLRRYSTELRNLTIRISSVEASSGNSAEDIKLLEDAVESLTNRIAVLEENNTGGENTNPDNPGDNSGDSTGDV